MRGGEAVEAVIGLELRGDEGKAMEVLYGCHNAPSNGGALFHPTETVLRMGLGFAPFLIAGLTRGEGESERDSTVS